MAEEDAQGRPAKSYAFADTPLTPATAEVLILELFGGRTVKRETIVSEVVRYHLDRGGLRPRGSSATVFKKALANLDRLGRAENLPIYGWWRVGYEDASAAEEDDDTSDASVEPHELEPITVDKSYGRGDEAVYAYSYPSDQKMAELQGVTEWPVKIGRSSSDVLDRVRQQQGTSNNEWPVVHFTILCDDSKLLEDAIHAILTLKGKRVVDAPGAEWYSCDVQWVLSTLLDVFPELLTAIQPAAEQVEQVGHTAALVSSTPQA